MYLASLFKEVEEFTSSIINIINMTYSFKSIVNNYPKIYYFIYLFKFNTFRSTSCTKIIITFYRMNNKVIS